MATPKKSKKRVGRPRANERQGLSTRVKILEAAERLFTHRGYGAVSINDITDAVGITKPTLYHYYGDKDNLFLTAILSLIRKASKGIEDAGTNNGISVQQQLTTIAHAYYTSCRMCMTHLLKDCNDNLSQEQNQLIRQEMERHIFQPLENIFINARDTGQFNCHNPRLMAEVSLSAVDGIYLMHSLNYHGEPDELAENCVELLIRHFVRDLGLEPKI